MKSQFSINYNWLPDDVGDVEERWTIAELDIGVGPWCATEVEDVLAKTVRSTARLSALHLAEWFATNWWRLLWEPSNRTYSWRASHRMGNVGHGYVWPDLTFESDWESVHVMSRPTARRDAEPIRYLNHFDHHLSVAEFESGVQDFVNGVIARLSHIRDSRTNLRVLWEDVTSERLEPETSDLRILEACMGYDPDEAPVDLLDYLLSAMTDLGKNAIKEIAVAYKQHAIPYITELSYNHGFHDSVVVQVPRYSDIRSWVRDATAHQSIPWRRAEIAANLAREIWDVTLPISAENLCELLQIRQTGYLDNRVDGWRSLMAGIRESDAPENFRVSLNSSYGTSRRFGLARLVADHITADEEDRFLPSTGSMTSRQKFQRAFAQEFLCPFDTLSEHLGTGTPDIDDIYDAASFFDVSPLTVHTILVNKGVLGRETLNERAV